jgi:glutaminase
MLGSGLSNEYLTQIFDQYKDLKYGEVASYIPELKKAKPSHFAISVVDCQGQILSVGESELEVTLQSVSKPFSYGFVLEELGIEEVHHKVGVEPTGEAFNSIIELEESSHRPFNPMINSGAIAISSMIPGASDAQKLQSLTEFFGTLVDRTVHVDNTVFLSEKKTGDRNRAIAYLMKNFGILSGDVESILDLYFQQCSILMNTEDMAFMAATLANGGVQPKTGKNIFKAEHVKCCLSLMLTCGMYDSAGRWAFEVGLPAKSGVSGAIIAVVPGVCGIAVTSPLLDEHGHSCRGLEVIKKIAGDHNFNIFNPRG